jgi:hypothetical protein
MAPAGVPDIDPRNPQPIIVLIGLAQERKRRVKGARTDDVGPDAQPVRGKSVIPYPALQVEQKGVPGATIGRGADSHRKSPLLNNTSGRKK